MKCVKKLYKVHLKKHYSKSHEKIMYKKIPGCIYLHFYTKEYLYMHTLISMWKIVLKKNNYCINK